MNIAICDDDVYWVKALQESVSQWATTRKVEYKCQKFFSPQALIQCIVSGEISIDVVFLDISFGNDKVDGVNAAKYIRKMGANVPIIFVTVDSIRAVDGYIVEAMGFLSKPIDINRMSLFLDRIIDNQKAQKSVTIYRGNEIMKLRLRDIIYVEVINHTLIYHTADSQAESRGTLSELLSLWDSSHFIQIHRSYVIAKEKIYNIKTTYPYSVNLLKGAEIVKLTVSRKYISKLLEEYSNDVFGRII